MHITAVLTAWLVLAAVLVVSGVGKLRHPEGAAEAAVSLGVPAGLRGSGLLRAHPWVELALAALLLLLPHPGSVVAAAATLVLLLGYLLLVCRVVASGEDATCHCFGSVGSGAVDGWTVARNVLLVLAAVVVLVDAALGQSGIARLTGLGEAGGVGGGAGGEAVGGTDAWWWVVAVAVTAAVTYLVVRPGSPDGRPGQLDDRPSVAPVLRLPIPDVPVRTAPDIPTVSLRDLVDDRPQVLLLLSPGCGPCRMISSRLADWQRELPGTGFLVAHAVSFPAVHESLPEWEPFFVQDADGAVARAFDDPARPWAVLLGADGRLDSAPAQGHTAIVSLVEHLRSAPDRAGADQTGAR